MEIKIEINTIEKWRYCIDMNDFDVSIFVINKNNDIIYIEEYDKSLDGDVVFVMLTNDVLNPDYSDDNTICISSHWKEDVQIAYKYMIDNFYSENFKNLDIFRFDYEIISCSWQIDLVYHHDIQNVPHIEWNYDWKKMLSDRTNELMSGYDTCKQIIIESTNFLNEQLLKDKKDEYYHMTIEEHLPAVMLAHHTRVRLGNKRYNGYLPAIGQLLYIFRNSDIVNNAFLKILGKRNPSLFLFHKDNVKDLSSSLKPGWQSCTIYDEQSIWAINSSNEAELKNKHDMYLSRVLPIFSIEK